MNPHAMIGVCMPDTHNFKPLTRDIQVCTECWECVAATSAEAATARLVAKYKVETPA